MSVCIIGAGFAGLACAYALKQAGIDVTIYEASSDKGGAVASYDLGPYKIEKFYHHMSQHDFTAFSTIKKLGLGNRLEFRLAKNAYYVNGKSYNINSIFQILRYPYMSLMDKIRLARLTKKSLKFKLGDYDDIPLKDWILQHISERCYENFFLPGLRSKLGENLEKASAAWMISRLQYRSHRGIRGEKLGYLRGGFHQLVEALVREVGEERIKTNSRVTGMKIEGNNLVGIAVNDEPVHTNHCVITVNPSHVRQFLPEYSNIDFQGSLCMLLATKEKITNSYWTNIADKDTPFGAVIEHTNFMPLQDYAGDHLTYLGIYVQNPQNPLWTMNDEDLKKLYMTTLKRMFPDFKEESIKWIKIGKLMGAAPIYDMGYLKKIIPYELPTKGIYYAGMCSASNYPERSINGSLEAGFKVAEKIIQNSRR